MSGVSTMPGEMQLTLTPRDAHSQPSDCVSLTTADFDAAIAKLSSSVAEQGPEMAKVLEWNAQYGEVKKDPKTTPNSLYF